MEVRPGLRREGPRDLEAVGQDEVLVEKIREEIRSRGPMTFARFMEIALYDPDRGYYRAPDARPGRLGDFVTAPELHPIFGETLATAVLDIRDRLGPPERFTIREFGAGTGALARPLLSAIRAAGVGSDAIRYQAVDVDDRRASSLATSLSEADLLPYLDAGDTEPIEGIVLANEVLDALPVHRVRRRGDLLRELAVDATPDGGLVEVEIPPSTPALAARLETEAVSLADGQTAEIGLAADGWIRQAAAGLRRGVLLLIDYGAVATELYDPVRRRDGTLRAYVRHQVHDDPFRHVGRQDLTAHVDVSAVESAAHAVGLSTIGLTTQAEALMGLGIEERLRAIQADPATSFEEYRLVRAALMRLLDPAAMGRFRVMVFGRDVPDDPQNRPLGLLSYRLPERRTTPPRTR